MDSAANARPFPFFKLPGEVRNEIYRLVIVTRRILLVQDMRLQEYEKSQSNGAHQSRSNYLATDHVCRSKDWLKCQGEPCLLKNRTLGPKKTTYTLGTRRPIDHTTTIMLSLNKQSREEVASIFYGENTFHFITMSSLIPFMKDRTVETRKYIQRLWLTLTVDDRYWDAIFTEYRRPAAWNTAFSALVKLPHLNLKKLCVVINDKRSNLLKHGLNLRSRSMLWLHKLSRLEDLEMLGLKYVWVKSRRQRDRLWEPLITTDEEASTETEQDLWNFLAPKMLKKQTGDPSPDACQRRRVQDFYKPRKARSDRITWDSEGPHLEPESDSDDEW